MTLVLVLSMCHGFTTRQIFVEMFCTNLQSPVWSRHVGVPQWNTNMAARENSVNIWNLL